MFVFVTKNSINNAWVYFESGYAYSKGVEVIPVGIGITVGDLKPPLNLLQGFNVTSNDSLNNFITVINKKFDLNFKEDFSVTDYNQIKAIEVQSEYNITDIFHSATHSCSSQYSGSKENEIIRYDLSKAMEEYQTLLMKRGLNFSSGYSNEFNRQIVVKGVKFQRIGDEKEPSTYNSKVHPNQEHKLLTSISTNNFAPSFELVRELSNEVKIIDISYLHFNFTKNYSCVQTDIELSSILGQYSTDFSPIKDSVNSFTYKDSAIFSIFDKNKHDSRKEKEYCLAISFKNCKNPSVEIIELIAKLVDVEVIFSI